MAYSSKNVFIRCVLALPGSREWRNRQTRTVQVRVPERVWGFNSPLAHRPNLGESPWCSRVSLLSLRVTVPVFPNCAAIPAAGAAGRAGSPRSPAVDWHPRRIAGSVPAGDAAGPVPEA